MQFVFLPKTQWHSHQLANPKLVNQFNPGQLPDLIRGTEIRFHVIARRPMADAAISILNSDLCVVCKSLLQQKSSDVSFCLLVSPVHQ